MDNVYHLDYDAILKTVRTADVVAFRFVTVQERLLIDNRFTAVDPPMVKLVPKVASAEERFKSLKMLRPHFRLPSKITAIWWPRYVNGLTDSGVWQAIVERVVENGFPDAAKECDALLDELRRMERAEMLNAIHGQGYRTLWPASR
ncbi:MAG TPA: hypothetical protein VEZ14_10190 [Dehalococcoidia bacterium]|nr:hypothetical protein [Dehalococcoidia bacterium]